MSDLASELHSLLCLLNLEEEFTLKQLMSEQTLLEKLRLEFQRMIKGTQQSSLIWLVIMLEIVPASVLIYLSQFQRRSSLP